MVVHQNITNLAGYFHFLNVRKIPYVIPGISSLGYPPMICMAILGMELACESMATED